MPIRTGPRSAAVRRVGNITEVIDPLSPWPDLAPGQQYEFPALARQSGRLLHQISDAQLTGAENLLNKASRHLAAGDMHRAEHLIRRAAQMPFDEREEASPAIRAGSMMVFRILCDELEESPSEDMFWLDVVLDVYPSLDPTGRAEVASVVHGFVLQPSFYEVSPAEKRRIQKAFGDAPLEAELGDGPNATVEQRHEIIRSLIMAANALEDAYEQAATEAAARY